MEFICSILWSVCSRCPDYFILNQTNFSSISPFRSCLVSWFQILSLIVYFLVGTQENLCVLLLTNIFTIKLYSDKLCFKVHWSSCNDIVQAVFQYYIIFQSVTTLEDDKLITISKVPDGSQTSRSYSFFDAGMLLVCIISITYSWSAHYIAHRTYPSHNSDCEVSPTEMKRIITSNVK